MKNKQRILIWGAGLAAIFFAFFLWLFNLAIPELALSFATGITVVLVGGLFSGHSIYNVWLREVERVQKSLFVALSFFILAVFVGIGALVNSMIRETTFLKFSLTILLLFLLSASAGTLISLVRNRIKTRIQKTRMELAHSKSELQLLQSQLSPHFLFNTLNNVYGLSITDHEKVPALLLKLSELLRYSVYDAKELFVPLCQELDYLSNYIDFEKIRLGDRLVLTLNFDDVTDQSLSVPPMLFIVFIENAFKHSRDTPGEKIFIDISVRTSRDEIVLSVRNSCYRSDREGSKEKHSGVGLNNVRKRLSLMYENRHELTINESESDYSVNLKLKR